MLKKYSVNPIVSRKRFLLLTVLAYIICWGIILVITFWGSNKDAIDLESVRENKANFFYVFSSNSKSMLLASLGGIFTFGIISSFVFFYNAISLGKIANALLLGDMPRMAERMLPHSIFELLALAIMAVFPIILDVFLVRKVKPIICQETSIKETLRSALLFVAKNIVLIEMILIMAGLIESTFS